MFGHMFMKNYAIYYLENVTIYTVQTGVPFKVRMYMLKPDYEVP